MEDVGAPREWDSAVCDVRWRTKAGWMYSAWAGGESLILIKRQARGIPCVLEDASSSPPKTAAAEKWTSVLVGRVP